MSAIGPATRSRALVLAISLALLSIAVSESFAELQDDPSRVTDTEEPTLPEVVVSPDSTDGPAETAASDPDATFDAELDLYSYPFSSPVADGYLARSASSGMGIDVPMIDFPGSIETITRQVMDDQQAIDLLDLSHNVSGVYIADADGSFGDKIILRGFEIDGNSDDFRKNGFRDLSRTQRDMANVERIEFLKGPASVLYGATGQPSGIINLITKKPLDYRYRSAKFRMGSYDDYRFTFDSTGPISDRGNGLYRLNLAAQDSGSFRDFVSESRFFISPVLQYRLDDLTTLTFELEYLHDNRVPDRGIPIYKGGFEAVPISRFLGEPDNYSRVDDGQVGVFLNRLITPDLAWQIGYVSNWSAESRAFVEQSGNRLSGTEVKRRVKDENTVDSDHYFIGNITGTAHTGNLKHRVVLGTELGTTIRHKDGYEGNGTSMDIFAPVYGVPQPVPTNHRPADFQDDQYGLYAMDLIEIGAHLKGLVGVRWDSYQGKTYDTRLDPNNATINESVLNPRFGLVLQPIPEICSLYAGYSESFSPQTGVTRLGAPYVPERGEMYEVGMKFALLDQRLLLNLAGFDIFQRNTLVNDPIDSDYAIQVGEAESKGVEFDIVGQLTDPWSIIANCAYTDARITNDTDSDLLGNRLPNVPYFGCSLWTHYDFMQCCCKTLGVATGVVYRGERQGDIDNSYQLPSYTRWDAGVYYQYERLKFSLLAENLLDTFYIASGKSQVANIPGTPFNLVGTLRIDY